MMVSAADFEWDEFFWVTKTQIRDRRVTDAAVQLTFAPEGRDEAPLTDDEVALISKAVDVIDEAVAAAVDAIYIEYPSLQEQYGYDETERPQFMPDLDSIDGLYKLIEVIGVMVHQIDRSGVPYIGFEFGCSWDPEHGAGVLMNGTRVVDTGGADTAMLLWIAKRDRDA